MKKLLNIICVLALVFGLFFSSVPVSFAEPIDDAVDFSGESSTHESSSGDTRGGHGGTFSDSSDDSSTPGSNDFFNDTENVGDNFCSEPSIKKVLKFFGFMILILKFLVPIIIIVKGMFLFYNAMVKGGTDDLSKNAKELGIKIVIGLLVFFIPSLLEGILGLYNGFSSVKSEYTDCAECLLDPVNKCS